MYEWGTLPEGLSWEASSPSSSRPLIKKAGQIDPGSVVSSEPIFMLPVGIKAEATAGGFRAGKLQATDAQKTT